MQCKSDAALGLAEVTSPPPLRKNCRPVYDRTVASRRPGEAETRRVGIVAICTGERASMVRSLGRLLEDHQPPDRA